jgi:hypothetical protein
LFSVALPDLERVARELLDALADAPAVQRCDREGLQDQKVECALKNIG